MAVALIAVSLCASGNADFSRQLILLVLNEELQNSFDMTLDKLKEPPSNR